MSEQAYALHLAKHQFQRIRLVKKGQKNYRCFWCEDTIHRGETHFYLSGVYEGFYAVRACVSCHLQHTRTTRHGVYCGPEEHLKDCGAILRDDPENLNNYLCQFDPIHLDEAFGWTSLPKKHFKDLR